MDAVRALCAAAWGSADPAGLDTRKALAELGL
jgi:hypothetical protein